MGVSEFNLNSVCTCLCFFKLVAHLLFCLQLVKVFFANWTVQVTHNNTLTTFETHFMLARSELGFGSHNIAYWTLIWIRIYDLSWSCSFFDGCFLWNSFRSYSWGWSRFLDHLRLCLFKAFDCSYLPVFVLHQFRLIAISVSGREENDVICSDACICIWGSAI